MPKYFEAQEDEPKMMTLRLSPKLKTSLEALAERWTKRAGQRVSVNHVVTRLLLVAVDEAMREGA